MSAMTAVFLFVTASLNRMRARMQFTSAKRFSVVVSRPTTRAVSKRCSYRTVLRAAKELAPALSRTSFRATAGGRLRSPFLEDATPLRSASRIEEPVPASLLRSCPRSFDCVRAAHFAQDDRKPMCFLRSGAGSFAIIILSQRATRAVSKDLWQLRDSEAVPVSPNRDALFRQIAPVKEPHRDLSKDQLITLRTEEDEERNQQGGDLVQ